MAPPSSTSVAYTSECTTQYSSTILRFLCTYNPFVAIPNKYFWPMFITEIVILCLLGSWYRKMLREIRQSEASNDNNNMEASAGGYHYDEYTEKGMVAYVYGDRKFHTEKGDEVSMEI
ncbi:MAG: hypothetical protein Q9225_002446 [Loekoesia sp. 1 TL-2023]